VCEIRIEAKLCRTVSGPPGNYSGLPENYGSQLNAKECLNVISKTQAISIRSWITSDYANPQTSFEVFATERPHKAQRARGQDCWGERVGTVQQSTHFNRTRNSQQAQSR